MRAVRNCEGAGIAVRRSSLSTAECGSQITHSNDPAHIAALQAYVSSFEFTGDPIDIALRKLLMELTLPKETQQIDRVMEAFAQSYHQQNPSLFPSYDQPYLLAFASILLHSDAFNANNKSKMSKAAFIKNTRSDNSLPVEVLSYLYDNICFSPFIFVDEVDINGQRSVIAETSSSTFLSSIASKPRVDPYYLIQQKLTRTLRAEVELHIPSKSASASPASKCATVRPHRPLLLHWHDAFLQLFLPPSRLCRSSSSTRHSARQSAASRTASRSPRGPRTGRTS